MSEVVCTARHFDGDRWHSCTMLVADHMDDNTHECLCGMWHSEPLDPRRGEEPICDNE